MIPGALREHPWAITTHGLELCIAIASRDEFFPEVRKLAIQAYDDKPLDNTHTVEMRDGIAIVLVRGPLFRHASSFAKVSAATSYGELRKDMQVALDDPGCKAILWDFDSPGGEVNGVAELCEAIYEARDKKPMRAFASGTCASAAYWLAAAVGRIDCSPTSELGSIGCKMVLVDDSKRQVAEGEKRIEIVSSQSPGKGSDPGDDLYRSRLQAHCDAFAQIFIAGVARYRGITPQDVQARYGRGDVLIGDDAVQAGLADGVDSFESVFAAMKDDMRRINSWQGVTMEPTAIARALKIGENENMEERARALTQVESDLLAITGEADAASALGKVRAGIEAIAERDQLKAEAQEQAQKETQAEFRSVLKSACKDGRLSLGELVKVVPTFLKDEQAAIAIAALERVDAQERKPLLDAVCSASISPKRLRSLKAYLEAKAPQTEDPHGEPPHGEAGNRRIFAVTEQQCQMYGVSPEALQKYGAAESVEQIHEEAKKERIAAKSR